MIPILYFFREDSIKNIQEYHKFPRPLMGQKSRNIFDLAYILHSLEVEKFYLNSTLNFGIPPVLVFQLEVYYKVERLLTGLPAQQTGTTARWYSNKSSLNKTK